MLKYLAVKLLFIAALLALAACGPAVPAQSSNPPAQPSLPTESYRVLATTASGWELTVVPDAQNGNTCYLLTWRATLNTPPPASLRCLPNVR